MLYALFFCAFLTANAAFNASETQMDKTGPCRYSCASTTAARSFGASGLNMLTFFEGFSSTCYRDSEGIWTIGYGHACLSTATDLPEFGVVCRAGQCSGSLTRDQARTVLNRDVATFVSCVNNAVRVPVTQNQFDAMVSFAFNVGCGGFQSSTFLSMLNSNTLTDSEAQYQLTRWHSGCTNGLMRRRFTEAALYRGAFSNPCNSGSFPCNSGGCGISLQWNTCRDNCQYCSACGGCTSNTGNSPTCQNS